MIKRKIGSYLALVALLLCAWLPATADELVKVDVFNYVNAKTSIHFERVIAKGDSFNAWLHNRNPVQIDAKSQSSRRLNRDTLYSYAIVNISDGASIHIPESQGRYLSVQVINEDHFNNRNYHEPGDHQLSMDEFDTPYVLLLARVLADANDTADIEKARVLQDKLGVKSNNNTPYRHPNFDPKSLATTTKTLLSLADALPDANKCFGKKEDVDAIRHLLATAYGWGGLPENEATYENVQPNLPLGAYSLTVKDVPVDGFWSISVYNKDGYFEKNSDDLYSINNLTADANSDGSYTIHFGGDPQKPNYLPITEGWNYVVRMYRPRPEIINGKWKFPRAS